MVKSSRAIRCVDSERKTNVSEISSVSVIRVDAVDDHMSPIFILVSRGRLIIFGNSHVSISLFISVLRVTPRASISSSEYSLSFPNLPRIFARNCFKPQFEESYSELML
jgi:hypothetical protein